MQETRLDSARIRAARSEINPIFLDTPLYRCEGLELELGCKVSIKLETANPVRSFKARGTEVVASLLAGKGWRAVVCASAGNLGQALAWSGRDRGIDVTVVASRFAPAAKLDRIRALGARLELVDGDFETARERAAAIAQHNGIRLVEDSLDIGTCEGAATIGLELVESSPSFDAVLIALGGGALATGGYAWKRLRIICSEDVGIAWPDGPAVIRALYENWLEARKAEPKGTPPDRSNAMLFLVHAIVLLVRSPKSRLVDNACAVFYAGDRAAMGMEIPEYAVDHHTARGRRLGRREATAYDESYRIVNASGDDPYAAEAKAIDVPATDR